MKVEIKHYCAYLPYGVQATYTGEDRFWLKNGHVTTILPSDIDMMAKTPEFKMHLKPLSKYGDVIGRAMIDLNCDIDDQIAIEQFANQQISLASLPYSAYEVLVRNKVDIFDLIPQNLAIDLNTLKP